MTARPRLPAALVVTFALVCQAADQGPRLPDAELLAALDPAFEGMAPVVRLRDQGKPAAAFAALAALIRAREEPGDFGQRAPRDPAFNVSGAEAVLCHRFVVGGIPHTFGPDIDWTFNPTTAPGSPYDRDNEWTWQLNRHGAWSTLARAYQATGDERFAREFDRQFADWVADCPVPADGANQRPFSPWRTIEAGIRLSSTWPGVFVIFRRSPSVRDATLLAMVKSMVEHGRYLRSYPTSGNWLTMEMNGLYHAGALLPFVRDAAGWRTFALTRLLEELDRQVYPDGAQIELTPGYHNVSLRNFLGPVETARAYGHSLPGDYVAKLERMFAYNLWAMRPDRDLPRWNDSWHVNVRSYLATGFELFPHRADFQWIATDGAAGTAPDHTSHYFPYAGQVIFRSGWDRDALFLGFEVGPFGYGHQHEDKLGVVLFAHGRALLVEGGSYAYDASKWRSYVLSSHAHNVVLVDGEGQHRRGSPRSRYVATEPLDASFHTDGTADYARGVYDEGFGRRGNRTVRHEREAAFLKEHGLFLLRDTVESLDGKEHAYDALFHLDAEELSPAAQLPIAETRAAAGPNLRIVPSAGPGLSVTVVRGQESPVVQGWLPRGHGIRGVRPIPTLIMRRSGATRIQFLTVLQPLRDGTEDRVIRVEAAPPGAALGFASGKAVTWAPPSQPERK